ncbi:MAG: DUF4097 family beta strand repeat-containing protein [Candidatus Metalachnospira sp.]|nr:DUF4097 family beta strand repeat-containing protein [Candidatus Metalachnospira sp.]
MNKRDTSIFKIIIWSLIALFLISILVSGIRFKSTNIRLKSSSFNFFSIGSNHYFDSSSYSSGNNEVDAAGLSDIEINWIDGSVNIEGYDGDTIKFYEECGRELDDNDLLHYCNSGNKLTIQYSSSKKIPISLGGFDLHKSLTVQVPESMMDQFNDLTIDAVSSDINIKNINSKYIDIESLSGKVSLSSIKVSKIDVETASGDIDSDNITVDKTSNMSTISGNVSLNGSISDIDFESTSGDLKVNSNVCPSNVDTDTTSGNVTLNIPDNDGFTYSCDGLSGDLKCDFPTNVEKGEGTYGNGNADFSFNTVSGDINILKN